MTNLDYIRQLKAEVLAEMLVKEVFWNTMVATDGVANINFTKEEIEIIEILLSERIYEMKGKLDSSDLPKFVQISELKGKVSAILHIIGNKSKKVQEQNSEYAYNEYGTKIVRNPCLESYGRPSDVSNDE